MFSVAQTPAVTPLRVRVQRTHRARSVGPVRASASDGVTRRDAMLGAAATAVVLGFPAPARALDIGATAPPFTLPATGGGTVALGDVVKSNKYTVLYFYNQDFSAGCSIEAERFNQAIGDFKAAGATVVGVSMDPMEKHEEFCTAKGLGFKLLSDGDGSVSAAYGADLKIPLLGKFSDRQTFLIDGSGTVVGHWLERDGSMANVKTPAHTAQILDAIGTL
ncbi:peroxiredoxin [bacterium]|jgi:peroxiredoxin Q/BCP|nr:peroxiredoxin [bacterium]|tara:strand:- start:17768 stop:18427 length:660 start_codon:yes stop_codon:yes gene_type:complete